MVSKGFWQGSSLQVLQNAANTYVETRNLQKKHKKKHKWNIPVHWIHKKKHILNSLKKNI